MNAFQLTYGLSLISPNLVEAEHHFWFWTSTMWVGYLAFNASRYAYAPIVANLIPFVLQLLLSYWNTDRSEAPCDAHGMQGLLCQHPFYSWVLIAATFLTTSFKSSMQLKRLLASGPVEDFLTKLAYRIVLLAAIVFKFASACRGSPDWMNNAPEWLRCLILQQLDLLFIVQFVFVSLVAGFVYLSLRMRSTRTKSEQGKTHFYRRQWFSTLILPDLAAIPYLLELINIYLITQTTPENIPLFIVYRLQLDWLRKY